VNRKCSSADVQSWEKKFFDELSIVEQPFYDSTSASCTEVAEALQVLGSICHTSPQEAESFRRMSGTLKSGNDLSHGDITFIFSFARMNLKKYSATLQQLIATDDSRLARHLRRLQVVSTLLKLKLHFKLQPGDGVIYTLFSTDQPSPFVQVVVLQLLDVLFAFFNPNAWAMADRHRRVDVLNLMAPLRDALSCIVPLLEIGCEYVLSRVECQRWWKSPDGKKCFVSSMDPSTYKLCIESAQLTQPVKCEFTTPVLQDCAFLSYH